MDFTKSISSYTSASTLKSMQCRGLVYLLAIAQSFLFTKLPDGLRPSHTIKSVVFLLDLLAGVCGKRYIKSASSEPMFSCIA